MKSFRTLSFAVLRTAVLLLSLNLVHRTEETVAGCGGGGGAADVVFLLDSSFSVWRSDFRRQLTFVQEVIEMLPIGPNDTRVAIVTYADHPQLQFHLHEHSSKPELRAAVEGIRQRGGFQTINGDAIRFVRRNVFGVGSKSRPLGVNVARVVVVVTDGRSDNRTATVIEAELAKLEGVRMFLVGVGKDVDMEELKDIGSLPSDNYTFVIDNFAGLAGLRDLVATQTCKVAESVRSSKAIETHDTGARLLNTKAVSTETSISSAPFVDELQAKPDHRGNASLAKAVHPQIPDSTRKTSVKTTLRGLVSTAIDSISTAGSTTPLPSRAPYPKSTFTRPAFVRIASSGLASIATVSNSAAVTSAVSFTMTHKATSVFSQTSTEGLSFTPSPRINSAEGLRKVEDLQPPSDKPPLAITISDIQGVQTENNETDSNKQHPETDDEEDRNEDQQKSRSAKSKIIDSVVENEKKVASYSSNSSKASTTATLAQVTDGVNDASSKTTLESTIRKSTRRAYTGTTDSTASKGSKVITDHQERKLDGSSGGPDEQRVLSIDKGATDHDDRDQKGEDYGRLDHDSGFQARDYWRLSEGGELIRQRMISPGVFEREKVPRSRTPRLPSNRRRLVIPRSDAIHPSALDDSRGQEKTDGESRGNISRASAAHGRVPIYPSRMITRTIDRRVGYPRGSDVPGRYRHHEAVERRSRERSHTHRPQTNSSGFWRINDEGRLVWIDNPPSSPASTGIPNTRFTHVNSNNFSRTHSHHEVNGADHLASNSGAHPRLTTDKPIAQGTLRTTEVGEGFSKPMARSSNPPKPSGSDIESHNPKHGFWKYDSSGQKSIWVSYTNSDDGTSTAPAPARESADPTSGTKGPSLAGSADLSYGYWKREKGKTVWYEYQSPGVYRKVIDTDYPAVPNKIRIELPPGVELGCTGCNFTGSPPWKGTVKVNQSSSSEEVVVVRANDRLDRLNRTRPTAFQDNSEQNLWQAMENLRQRLSEGFHENSSSSSSENVRREAISAFLERSENRMSLARRYNRTFFSSSDHGFHQIPPQFFPNARETGDRRNSKANWTYEDIEAMWAQRNNGMEMEKVRSQRKNTTRGVPPVLRENQRASLTSTPGNIRLDGAVGSAKTTSSVLSSSSIRRQLESGNPKRVTSKDSAHKKGGSVRRNPTSAATNNRKHGKGCVPRRPLDVVFVVDPRARKRPYTRHLWQLAYEIVSQVKMDDDRVKVRFYPELEVVKTSHNNGSGTAAEYGSVERVFQRVAQKTVPELLRAASRLLTESNREGVRRIGLYLTDGPSGSPLELDRAVEEVRGDAAVEMFVVGIGQEINPAELESIADSKLKGRHLYRLGKPTKPDIDAVALKLTRALCGGR